MADGQDFTELGLDMDGFSEPNLKLLQGFIKAFEDLNKYANLKINPVLGTGLVEFNKSLTDTSALLTELNAKIAELNKGIAASATGANKGASSTKAMTAEQAKLKVELQEANRAMLEQAKAQNASVQAREKAAKATQAQQKAEADFERARKEAHAENRKRDREAEQALERKRVAANKAAADQKKADAEQMRDGEARARELDRLADKYKMLKESQQQQASAYANMLLDAKKNGVVNPQSDPAIRAAFEQLQQTSTTINQIESGLGRATQGAGQFGNTLTKGLSGLRTIAYILPGIGIAGIFNLAFEAIGKAVEAMGWFTDGLEKQLKLTQKVNTELIDQLGIVNDLADQEQKRVNLYSESVIGQKRNLSVEEAEGLDKVKAGTEEITIARQAYNEAFTKSKAISKENVYQFIKDQEQIAKRISDLERVRNDVSTNKGLSITGDQVKYQEGVFFGTSKQLDLEIETEKKLYETKKAYNQDSLRLLKDTTDREQELLEAQAKHQKLIEDEKRNRIVANAKAEISVNDAKNNAIIQSDLSSEQVRRDAIEAMRKDAVKSAGLDLFKVEDNNSSTKDEKLIAQKKYATDVAKINLETNTTLAEQDEQYRQLRLKLDSEMAQNEINVLSVRDERIMNNEQDSMEDRIAALTRYIQRKQQMQDIQLTTELDQNKYKTGDENARLLTEKAISDAAEQKANIQADVERRMYDIVYQSTQKQLKLILDENTITIQKNKEAYGEHVRDLTDSYRNRAISYKKYKEELKKIDDEYAASSLDKTIEQDKQAEEAIRANLKKNVIDRENAKNEMDAAQNELIKAKEGEPWEDILPAQEKFDAAVGRYKGLTTAVQQGEKALNTAHDKTADDQFKRDNLRLTEDQKKKQQWMQAIKSIEQSLYNTIKSIGDQKYEYRKQQVDAEKRLVDEQYGYEIAAIQKSSLTAKDKQALDIQLQAQKHQKDVEFQKEERKIAHDKAVFDKDLSIAHIILSTAEAVAASLPIVPLAIAAGVAGAAELAVATSVQIPAYKHGTENHPGGYARFGEDGLEIVKEPYKSPYLVNQDTIGILPIGTRVIPVKDNPEFGGSVPKDDSWKQTVWLAKQIKKAMPDNRIVNNIHIDLGFETYKRKILGR